MAKKYFVFFTGFFLSSVFLISCFHKKERNYAETYYASGALKSKGWFWRDNILVDTAYYYFENGKISSIEVHNDSGILNGTCRFFYENGELYQICNYTNGLKEGFIYEYTKEGKLYSKVFYLHNRQAGDCYWYNYNGNFIRKYNFYDFEGNNINLITYDSITGKPVKNIRQNIFLDSVNIYSDVDLKPNERTYGISLLLSNFPKNRSTVRISYLSKNGIIIKIDSVIGKPYYFAKEQLPDSFYSINFDGIQYDSLTHSNYKQSDRKLVR